MSNQEIVICGPNEVQEMPAENVVTVPSETHEKPKRVRKPKRAKRKATPSELPEKPKRAKPAKKAPARKAKKEPKEKPEKPTGLPGQQVVRKKVLGPAAKEIPYKKNPEPGVCFYDPCKVKTPNKKRKWCAFHKKEIRRIQLAHNNVVWKKRKQRGEAGHHVVYRGKPTVFAIERPKEALRLVKNGVSVVPPEKFEPALERARAKAQSK